MKKLVFILALFTLSGCYSFKGTSIPPVMKTVTVQFFENNAQFVNPVLSQQFTEGLKDRIRTQSRLTLTPANGEAIFEGRITDYDIKPISIQDNAKPVAGANRLTITVSVKYTNTLADFRKQSFEQSFSASTDFSLAGRTLQSQEQELIKKVITQLTENVFNRAFAQW